MTCLQRVDFDNCSRSLFVETPDDKLLLDLSVVDIGYSLKDIEDERFIKVWPSCFIKNLYYNRDITSDQGWYGFDSTLHMPDKIQGLAGLDDMTTPLEKDQPPAIRL
jgi:hypothetical protein